jgi:hypothetical protein
MRNGDKDLLERAVGWYDPPDWDPEKIAGRSDRRARRRRVVAACVAIAILVGPGALLFDFLRGTQSPVDIGKTLPKVNLVATSMPLPSSAFGVAATNDAVWVASLGRVLKIDPAGPRVVASIPVSDRLDDQDAIAASGSVWVTVGSLHEVVEIDPSSDSSTASYSVVSVPGFPVQIAADDTSVWVISASSKTNGSALLIRIDPKSGAITQRIPIHAEPRLGFAVEGGAAWVDEGDILLRVAADGTRSQLPGSGGPLGTPIAVGDGSVWFGNPSGVRRVDATSGNVLATITTALPPIGLSFSDGSLWVLTATGSTSDSVYQPDPNRPSTVLRIDPATNRVDAGPVTVGSTPAWLAAGGGAAWVVSYDPARLVRVAPSQGSSPAPGITLPGVPFQACAISSVRFDMTGDGEPDLVYVFSEFANEHCDSRTAYVGLQPGGVGPVNFDPASRLRCQPRCSVLATPRLGPSANPAVAVATIRGFFVYFRLFGLEAGSASPKPFAGPGGKPIDVALAGSSQSLAGVECAGGRLISWSAGETQEGAGPYSVERDIYSISGTVLTLIRHQTSLVPQNERSLLPQGGGIALGGHKALCGSPLIGPVPKAG